VTWLYLGCSFIILWSVENFDSYTIFFHCTYLQFESRSVDAEFVRLMHDLQSTEIVGHKYRGYTLLTQDGSNLRSIKVSMQLNTRMVFSLSCALDQYIILWKSLLPYYRSCIFYQFLSYWSTSRLYLHSLIDWGPAYCSTHCRCIIYVRD
jgi:hypothetical protein